MNLSSGVGVLIVDVDGEAETDRLGAALASAFGPGTVVGLIGPLGAGKTRLVRAIAQALGVVPEDVSSPTFVLIQEYEGTWPIFHFDTYRLKNAEEFTALDPAGYFGQRGVCLIEWADRVADDLPPDAWSITIGPTGPETRRVIVRAPDGHLLDRVAAGLGDF
jgi:tRNA threonylcarbamoyladenosine biosynthesis protein TsaE